MSKESLIDLRENAWAREEASRCLLNFARRRSGILKKLGYEVGDFVGECWVALLSRGESSRGGVVQGKGGMSVERYVKKSATNLFIDICRHRKVKGVREALIVSESSVPSGYDELMGVTGRYCWERDLCGLMGGHLSLAYLELFADLELPDRVIDKKYPNITVRSLFVMFLQYSASEVSEILSSQGKRVSATRACEWRAEIFSEYMKAAA